MQQPLMKAAQLVGSKPSSTKSVSGSSSPDGEHSPSARRAGGTAEAKAVAGGSRWWRTHSPVVSCLLVALVAGVMYGTRASSSARGAMHHLVTIANQPARQQALAQLADESQVAQELAALLRKQHAEKKQQRVDEVGKQQDPEEQQQQEEVAREEAAEELPPPSSGSSSGEGGDSGDPADGSGEGGAGGADTEANEYTDASQLQLFAGNSFNGTYANMYFKWSNVRLGEDGLTFYAPPDFEMPSEEYWVDGVGLNVTQPWLLPTTMLLRGERRKGVEKEYYIPMNYRQASSAQEQRQQQQECTEWIEPTTYLLHVRYSHNIWHTWDEGIMAAWQTLREQGQLPVARVAADGSMSEEDGGLWEGCPRIFDRAANESFQPESCPPTGRVPKGLRCDPKKDAWCREGAVVTVPLEKPPMLLIYTEGSTTNPWAHLYANISSDMRPYQPLAGACYRNLIIGKTSTLNLYVPINFAVPDNGFEKRVDAMSLFHAWVTTAQREWRRKQSEADPAGVFKGYPDAALERLRRGVGPEQMDALDRLLPQEVPGMEPGEFEELQRLLKGGAAADLEEVEGGDPVWGDPILAKGRKQKAGKKAPKGGKAAQQQQEQKPKGGKAKAAAAEQQQAQGRRRLAQDPAQEPEQELAQPPDFFPAGLNAQEEGSAAMTLGLLPEVQKKLQQPLEQPRPVVTYMRRDFFSRSVLNTHEVLTHILSRYNVTLRVTSFEEPLMEVIDTLSHSDVVIGVHGAAWTNALFIKQGAAVLQLFPYGWRLPATGLTIRGWNYAEIVLARECTYMEWVNPRNDHAFFRRADFLRKEDQPFYRLHPSVDEPIPTTNAPGNHWVYQNMYVDMGLVGPIIDQTMAAAGIPLMPEALTRQEQAVQDSEDGDGAAWWAGRRLR